MSEDCLLGTGTDGASSVTGKQSDIVTKLSKMDGLTRFVGIRRIPTG
jgi:hypothetical protein